MKTENLPKPTSDALACRDWQGRVSRPSIPFNAKPVLSSEMVCLWVFGKQFIVSYGLQVTTHRTLEEAGREFDACRKHWEACNT
jgi:hypothetical protein